MNNEQNNNTNWLENEEKTLNNKNNAEYEKKEALKIETGKITIVQIDFTKPFQKWNTQNNGKEITKAIIPVNHLGIAKIWWLSIKNPVYADIIKAGRTGQTLFKIFCTGSQANTRYNIVKD